jgi:hypothetical protein
MERDKEGRGVLEIALRTLRERRSTCPLAGGAGDGE